MPAGRKRNWKNQQQFDAGFKACQIAAAKEIKKLQDEQTETIKRNMKLRDEIESLKKHTLEMQQTIDVQHIFAIHKDAQIRIVRNAIDSINNALQMKVQAEVRPVTYNMVVNPEYAVGEPNDNDRSPTRNNR